MLKSGALQPLVTTATRFLFFTGKGGVGKTSLVGTINEKGAHLHVSFADKNGAMHSGHVMHGCIVNGLEIVMVEVTE